MGLPVDSAWRRSVGTWTDPAAVTAVLGERFETFAGAWISSKTGRASDWKRFDYSTLTKRR